MKKTTRTAALVVLIAAAGIAGTAFAADPQPATPPAFLNDAATAAAVAQAAKKTGVPIDAARFSRVMQEEIPGTGIRNSEAAPIIQILCKGHGGGGVGYLNSHGETFAVITCNIPAHATKPPVQYILRRATAEDGLPPIPLPR